MDALRTVWRKPDRRATAEKTGNQGKEGGGREPAYYVVTTSREARRLVFGMEWTEWLAGWLAGWLVNVTVRSLTIRSPGIR